MSDLSLSIPTLSIKIKMKIETPMRLPPYKGSTLRGAFGSVFRQVCCVRGSQVDCNTCLLASRCAYKLLFETTQEAKDNPPDAPRPYVLRPPLDERTDYRPGDELEFGLVLIGKAQEYLPYFIYAFERLGEKGLGRGRGKCILEEVNRLDDNQLIYKQSERVIIAGAVNPDAFSKPAFSQKLILRFRTPLRIKREAHFVTELDFYTLVLGLARRLRQLRAWLPEPLPELKSLLDERNIQREIKTLENGHKLHWHDWERYSNRQQTRMKMGGLVGEIGFEGNFEPYWELINIGERIHVGKGATFGLGWYEVINN